jgi:hypothetical protein
MGSCCSKLPISSEGKSLLGSKEMGRKSRGAWRPENQRKRGGLLKGGTKPPPITCQKQAKCHLLPRLASKGDPIPIHIDKADITNDIPSDAKLRAVVRELQNRHAAGMTGLQVEHIKVWLLDVVCKEGEQSDVGLGHK